jgi:hypothetical protein
LFHHIPPITVLHSPHILIPKTLASCFRTYVPSVLVWRTYDGQELDLVEEREGRLYGYEFKWSERKKTKAPGNWIEAYGNAGFEIINNKNYLDFVT